ncbi:MULTISPECIES: hypothetical protein [unclassified Caballeronia]|uniref:flagellar basal body rod protein FlgB n=1 Tax=unclassified Caballeronia TaxID=2646786 RepID=UPI001FD219CB|nr:MULTISPECIES: hypothetical protein [unclassified Caballeronia]MDR5774160.1 hypothetical protein [Caballeronia sp. LZ002]MDR5849595.1 hypothetical protein [Caballeronia sp. LZ003]
MSIDLVSAIASKALDGLFVRQIATANNIANASSEGFMPTSVSFEDALRNAAEVHAGDDTARIATRVANVTPLLTIETTGLTQGSRLDREIATASETSARYAMVTGMLDRTLQMQMLAIKGA